MKSTFFYLFAVLLACGALITSCSDDDPIGGGGNVIGPGAQLLSGTSVGGEDFVTFSSEIDANGSFVVNLEGTSGDNLIDLLTITKDGANVSQEDLSINANPLLFVSGVNTYNEEITVQTDLGPADVSTYTFSFRDLAGNTDEVSVTISVSDVMTPPILTANGSMSDLTIEPSDLFNFSFDGSPRTSQLDSMAVYEDGILIASSRINVADATVEGNPFALVDRDGFTELIVQVRVSAEERTSELKFVLIDAAGLTAEVSRNVITQRQNMMTGYIEIPSVTLYNFAGPVATGKKGCVDLFDGTAYFRTEDEALGGVCDLIDDANNGNGVWHSSISPKNSAEIRVSSDADFGSTAFTGSDIVNEFETNSTIAATIASSAGQFFLVKDREGRYFGVRINSTNPTADDDCDSHNMTIYKVQI